MVKANYQEGDWFAVPLGDGGYAVGLVARAGRGGVLLGYFFGPCHDAHPTLSDVARLAPEGAILIGKFGHLGLTRREWKVLGRLDDWDRDQWPMPALYRIEPFSGRTIKVTYDADDPNKFIKAESVSPSPATQGPEDGLMGAGFVEERLTMLTRL